MRSSSSLLLAAALVLVGVSSSSAKPIEPKTNGNPNPGGNGQGGGQTPPAPTPVVCATSDVSFRDLNADACYGMVYSPANDFVGGQAADWSVNKLAVFGGDWEDYLKDGGTSQYLGLNWGLAADVDSKQGDWLLSVNGPLPAGKTLPITTDLMVVLKGSTGWSAYLFSPEIFATFGDYGGDFTMRIENNGGNVAELSHLTVYFRNGSLENEPTCNDGRPCPQPDSVPEPTSMALLGLGLLGAGLARRRK